MKTTGLQLATASLLTAFLMTAHASEKSVKVTPLGSHDGEFCRFDRALVFEDPDGTRILYDAGRTVRGPDDPRLGQIDAVLLSHVHGDHLGDKYQPGANAGSCETPEFTVNATPNSNSVNIVVGKKAEFIVGGEMASFFSKKVEAAGGDANQVKLVRFGAQRNVGGVAIASVPAVHSNGLNPAFLEAHNNLGNVLKDREKYRLAEKAYRRGLELAPDHPMLVNNVGNVLFLQQRYPEAEAMLERAIRLDPDDFRAHSNLGNVLMALDRPAEAIC